MATMTNEIIRLIKNYLNDFTIETTPNIYNKHQRFGNLLEKNHIIYVTYLPDENSKNVINTTKIEKISWIFLRLFWTFFHKDSCLWLFTKYRVV